MHLLFFINFFSLFSLFFLISKLDCDHYVQVLVSLIEMKNFLLTRNPAVRKEKVCCGNAEGNKMLRSLNS